MSSRTDKGPDRCEEGKGTDPQSKPEVLPCFQLQMMSTIVNMPATHTNETQLF